MNIAIVVADFHELFPFSCEEKEKPALKRKRTEVNS